MSLDAKSPNEKPTLWAGISTLLLDRTIVAIGLIFIVIMVLLIWRQGRLEDRLVQSTAQEEARRYTEALATFRTLYTRDVVQPMLLQGVVVTHDYDENKYDGKAIPLPATLSMLIGNEMAQRGSNGQTALYSGYPFPWREDEWQQRDQFAKDAWQAVTENPNEPYQRFENRDGRLWLRYATADLMQESCIECHNNHPNTPKNDWQEGDVRGVLEVSLPLDRAVAQTKSNLRTSIGSTVAIGMLGFVALVIVIGRLRGTSRELELRAAKSSRAEQRLRTMIACAPSAVLLMDRDGKIMLANPACEQMFGYGEGELIGQLVEVLIPQPLRQRHVQLRNDFFSDPELRWMGRGRELSGEHKDGSQFPVEIGLNPVDTVEGLCVVADIADLTDRKQVESLQQQLLEQSQAELNFAYVAGAPLADDTETSAIVRTTGDEILGIESFDDALDLWARQARSMVGAHQSAVSYIPHGNFPEGKHAISMSEKYDKYKTYDVLPTGEGIWRLVAKEKLSFCMTDEELQSHPGWKKFSDMRDDRGLEHPPMRGWLAVPVLCHDNDCVGVLQLTDKYEGDFTEDDLQRLTRLAQLMAPAFSLQFALEETQRRSEELAEAKSVVEQSNVELRQFAYIASHDLQEPLRSIAGFCQLLQRRYKGQLDPEADEWIEYAVQAAVRMRALVEDLLNYSRVDTQVLPFSEVDLSEVVDEAVAILAKSIEESGAKVTRDELPTVLGDHSQLLQVMQNLIGNGIKFHDDKPTQVHVSAQRTGDNWIFAVRDNGLGIPTNKVESIFEVFQRLHTQQQYPGTGIGLAICRRVVERHRGQIWVDSELGKGSTFYFTLGPGNEA